MTEQNLGKIKFGIILHQGFKTEPLDLFIRCSLRLKRIQFLQILAPLIITVHLCQVLDGPAGKDHFIPGRCEQILKIDKGQERTGRGRCLGLGFALLCPGIGFFFYLRLRRLRRCRSVSEFNKSAIGKPAVQRTICAESGQSVQLQHDIVPGAAPPSDRFKNAFFNQFL